MTTEFGLNLAGVEKVLELEEQLERMQRRVDALDRRARELQEEIARLEAVRDEVSADIVRYEQPGAIIRAQDAPHKIRIERDGSRAGSYPMRAVRANCCLPGLTSFSPLLRVW